MKKVPIPKPSLAQVVNGFMMVVESYKSNKKVQEEEKTKRFTIEQTSKVQLEKIQSQRAIMEQYLSSIFVERKQTINGLFDALDKGIENDNTELIQQSLGSIVEIAKEFPLKGIQKVLSDYKNPEVDRVNF